jgi:hypothetical protein
MTFGEAIKLAKEGKMIQRAGWNGHGLFVFMQVPASIPVATVVPNMQSLPLAVKEEFLTREKELVTRDVKTLEYNNQLALVDPSNNITGWSPSTSDALATDWLEYI